MHEHSDGLGKMPLVPKMATTTSPLRISMEPLDMK